VNEKDDFRKFWHRIMNYAGLTAIIQGFLGLMLLSNLYSPLALLFLLPMTNIAYPFLLQNAIEFQFWPVAIIVGTFFLFFVMLAIGETAVNVGSALRKINTTTPKR